MALSIGGINSALDTSTTSKESALAKGLSGDLNKISSDSSEEELKGVIKDFESYFVEQMLKKMKDTFTEGSDCEDKTASAYTDYFIDYAIEDISDQLIEDLGKNVTQELYEQMKRNYNI